MKVLKYRLEGKVGFGGHLIMEKYLRVDDCDYILYVANPLIIIEIYEKTLVLRSEIITLVLLLM